jgi:diguanylate cyclase (GGDEF)-like protein
MQAMINAIGDMLALAGIALLLAALLRIHSLSRELSNSAVAFRWRMLDGYIAFFIVGYVAYTAVFWANREHLHDLIIPTILFFGAVFVWTVSSLALQTVQDMRRVALLEQQNITDALTGLYNRRYLDKRISAEYASARRYGHPLSVLMLDIDHFKRLNDTHGHQAGDLALQFISRLILDGIRESDIAARFGGEEFVIIAPNTRLPAAGDLAERVRRRIESHELKLARAGQDRQTLHITVSIGVVELTPDMASGEQLIECADLALYQAKQAGRNRTIQHRHSPA